MQLTIVFMNTFCRILVTSKTTFQIVQFGKFVPTKMIIMDDAQDPYELEEDSMGEMYRLGILKHNAMEEDIKRLPQILQPP